MRKKWIYPAEAPCLGGCGEMIAIDTDGRKAKYRNNGGLYCADCVRKMLSEKMKKNNPMYNAESRAKMSQTLRIKGCKPTVLGGNGRGYTKGQKLLWQKLGRGWWAEFIVPTGHCRDGSGLPTHYKTDLANSYYGIAIEIDGGSHTGAIAKAEDLKKDTFLQSKGWK